MSYPSFYDESRVGELYLTNNTAIAAEGVKYAEAMQVMPAQSDPAGERNLLLLVDEQVDFVFPDGALSVPGAVEDTQRVIKFIFNNLDKLTQIAASLDTHIPIQIFSPLYWRDRKTGEMPDPFTIVSEQDFRRRFVPVFDPEWDRQWNSKYIKNLNTQAKKDLMLWTVHCLIATPGYSLVPALSEAILFWAAARQTNPEYISKGTDPFTENYSVLEAEVVNPFNPDTQMNAIFMDMLQNFDRIFIAGQAKSHCVLETIRSIVNHFKGNASHMLPRIHLLMDCMSSVAPVIDPSTGAEIVNFEKLCAPEYASWQKMGVKLVDSDFQL